MRSKYGTLLALSIFEPMHEHNLLISSASTVWFILAMWPRRTGFEHFYWNIISYPSKLYKYIVCATVKY